MENSYLTFIENTWNINTEREKKGKHTNTNPAYFIKNYYFNLEFFCIFLDPSTAYIIHWYDNTCTTSTESITQIILSSYVLIHKYPLS